MAKKKTDLDADVEKFIKLHKKAGQIAEGVDNVHRSAYAAAEDKYLKDEQGALDREKLDDHEIQEKFIDEMVAHYKKAAERHFSLDPNHGLDQVSQDQLLKAYAGVTKSHLKTHINRRGKGYTSDIHNNFKTQFMQDIIPQLKTAAGSHLSDHHKYALASKFGLDKITTFPLTHKRISDITQFADLYEDRGTITKKDIPKYEQFDPARDAYKAKEYNKAA